MGLCRYCGKKTGWFSDAHEDCIKKTEQAIQNVQTCLADAVVEGKQYTEIEERLKTNAAQLPIPNGQFLSAIKEGWSLGAVKRSIAQPISDSEFSAISEIYRAAGLTQDEVRKTPGFQAMVFSFLIWTVLHDEIDAYQGSINFNLQSGEIPVFGIANVLLSEERTTSEYVGGYGGASIRVGNGVYYHLGAVRGHKVQSTSLQEVDYGDFLMTTRAIYYGGTEHGTNFRLPYSQVVRFRPYSDAIGVCKNGSKERIFAPQHVRDAGWFLFNALQALSAKDSAGRAHPAH
jgi:hypothetical protein